MWKNESKVKTWFLTAEFSLDFWLIFQDAAEFSHGGSRCEKVTKCFFTVNLFYQDADNPL